MHKTLNKQQTRETVDGHCVSQKNLRENDTLAYFLKEYSSVHGKKAVNEILLIWRRTEVIDDSNEYYV